MMPDFKVYCPTCGKAVTEAGHLCVPTVQKDKRCEWCNALIVDERHLCSAKVKNLSYICNSCGRAAVKAAYLCKPEKIK